MARLMVSLGTLPARALSTAVRKRGFPPGSAPPLAATVISLSNLVQPLDFFASEAALVCLILDHRLWPDMRHLPGSWERFGGITRPVAWQGAGGLSSRARESRPARPCGVRYRRSARRRRLPRPTVAAASARSGQRAGGRQRHRRARTELATGARVRHHARRRPDRWTGCRRTRR